MSFWKQRDDFLKKFLTIVLSLVLCFLTACSAIGEGKPNFAFPITQFEGRNVKINANGSEIEGKLSVTQEQLFTLTLTSPDAVKDMKITHNVSENKTEFLDLTYSGNFLSSVGISEVFDAIKVMSNTENLTKDEIGYHGVTSLGKTFTVITDENGNILKITLEALTVEFI